MTDANPLTDELGPSWEAQPLAAIRAALEGDGQTALDAELLERVATEIPEAFDPIEAGTMVLRDLLRVETRPARFRRVLRIWVGEVGNAVRAGDFEAAGAWMRVITDKSDYPEEFADQVDAAFDELSRPALLDELMLRLVEAGDPEPAAPLLAAWGERLVNYMVDQMLVEEPVVSRLHMVGFLGLIGRYDTSLLLAHISDPVWYVPRNIAIAIGKAGRPQAAHALGGLLEHPEPRVRVEALRSLAALKGEESIPDLVSALDDHSTRVRQAAVSLLRANAGDQVVPTLMAVIEKGKVGPEEVRRLVKIVAERRDPQVGPALERLASRKVAFGAAKAAREAAREALRRRRP